MGAPSPRKVYKNREKYARKQANIVGYTLDPGGLVWTSKNKDIAKAQGQVDVLGWGADKKIAQRAAEEQYQEQVKQAEAAAAEEQRLVSAQEGIEQEKKRRADVRRAKRISRGSLLSTSASTGDILG